jgi:hypothetical protein
MSDRHTVVAGLLPNQEQAKLAFGELRAAGFAPEQIGVLARDPGAEAGITGHKETYAEEGGAYGAATGGTVGALTGWAVAAGLWVIPGVGPLVAAGTLATILAGAAAGAAVGGVAGVLIGVGIPEEEAHYYDAELALGRVLITVRADGRAEEARRILSGLGAELRPAPSPA